MKDLFQCIELLLKVRLEASSPLGLRDQPNNPTVLTRLAAIGVPLSPDEASTVAQLRNCATTSSTVQPGSTTGRSLGCAAAHSSPSTGSWSTN